jgi:hypothetical protein
MRRERSLAERCTVLPIALSLATATCGGSSSAAKSSSEYDPEVARYRLLLRENPVDPGEAFRCFGSCQKETKPDGYLGCLAQCPGFEVTQGIACHRSEVPPVAACITAGRLHGDRDEVEAGHVVVAVLASVALIVAVGSRVQPVDDLRGLLLRAGAERTLLSPEGADADLHPGVGRRLRRSVG